LYISPDIVTVIKSRRLKRAGHVARMDDLGNAYKTSVGKPEEKDHWEDLGVDRSLY